MHECPQCKKMCRCDDRIRFFDSFPECTHYISDACSEPYPVEADTVEGYVCRSCQTFGAGTHCPKCGSTYPSGKRSDLESVDIGGEGGGA